MADQPVYLCTHPFCRRFEGRTSGRTPGAVHTAPHSGGLHARCTGDKRCRVTVPHDCRPEPERDPLDAAAEHYADDGYPYQWERERAFRAGAEWAAEQLRTDHP